MEGDDYLYQPKQYLKVQQGFQMSESSSVRLICGSPQSRPTSFHQVTITARMLLKMKQHSPVTCKPLLGTDVNEKTETETKSTYTIGHAIN